MTALVIQDGILEIAHIKGGSQNINVRMTSTEFKIMNGTDFDVETHDGSSNELELTCFGYSYNQG